MNVALQIYLLYTCCIPYSCYTCVMVHCLAVFEAAMADGEQAFSHDGAPERFQNSGAIFIGKIWMVYLFHKENPSYKWINI